MENIAVSIIIILIKMDFSLVFRWLKEGRKNIIRNIFRCLHSKKFYNFVYVIIWKIETLFLCSFF